MNENRELIWVEKDFAIRYNETLAEKGSAEQKAAALDEYLEKVKADTRDDFKANLESLEEDVAVYTGLTLKVKQAFGKAKDEALSASYALWEQFESEKPSVSKKVSAFVDLLDPLEKKLNAINVALGKIHTYNIDRLIETMQKLTGLCGKNREMFDFIIKHFGAERGE